VVNKFFFLLSFYADYDLFRSVIGVTTQHVQLHGYSGYRPLYRQPLFRQNASEKAQLTLTLTQTLTLALALALTLTHYITHLEMSE